MQEIESKAEDLVLDIEQNLGTRYAEARSKQAPIWASISGHYILPKPGLIFEDLGVLGLYALRFTIHLIW